MMDEIPDHIYLQEGQELTLDQNLPLQLAVSDEDRAVMADVGESTYEAIQLRSNSGSCKNLEAGEHTVTCYLFGVLPVKEVAVSVIREQSLFASGHVVGIYGKTQGVLVLGTSAVETESGSYQTPAENIVFAGDYITAVNGEPIEEKEELVQAIGQYGDQPLVLTLWRGEEQIEVSVKAVPVSQDSSYMLGIWVKDDMAGIGTVTYYDTQGTFGALGHGISDGETGDLLRIADGRLYRADVIGIRKGLSGDPGELEGVVYYGKNSRIGTVESNTDIGIYGTLTTAFYQESCEEDTLYPVGYKQEVTTGSAVILSDASGELCVYHIVIDSLDYTPSDSNKGIRFTVDDENLLELTGGIVQGLSGSPIIQNGKIVGAVTHVLVRDSTKGYGIFVENMLEK
jgi:stage IV sporulation protein B